MPLAINKKIFQTRLLRWFDQHGRTHLPWQQNKTPYRVWISEIMLQQTQVATVIPYFERFMQHFPDVATLAKAHEDTVLHLWAGLGYYSRARNLHQAAKMVVTEYNNRFPDTLATLTSLPGIGPSTAGAILAIAFNQPATILDGNVKRVLARLHGIVDPINEKQTENLLWDIAVDYTPQKRIADYTQAIMDLGATFCTRSNPPCHSCPFMRECRAYQDNTVHLIPLKKATRTIPVRQGTFLIIRHQDTVLLQKRPAPGIWGGLFCLPQLEGATDTHAIQSYCKKTLHITAKQITALPSFRHTFSHYHLDMFPVTITIGKRSAALMESAQQIWYNFRTPETVGLPKPIQTIMRALR